MGRTIIKPPPLWKNDAAEADQHRAIRAPERISLMATGTKVGKTLGEAIWILFGDDFDPGAVGDPDSLSWWVAPYRKTAKIGYKRCCSLLPAGKFDTNESDLSITLKHNRAKIEFRTAENPDALFGEGVKRMVIDEGGRVREESKNACFTTMLQTRGRVRIGSNTDKGKRNWLYRDFLRGQSKEDPEIASFHIRSTEAPHFMEGGIPGPGAIEELRKQLSNIAYRALVLAEFPDDASTVFPGLSKCLVDEWNGVPFDSATLPRYFMVPPFGGGLYVGGVDLANRRNFTVITVMDAISGLVVYWARFQHVMWADQLERIRTVQDLYGCPFLVDSTPGSVGDPVLEMLQIGGVAAEGYEFTNRSKQWLVDKLSIGVQEGRVKIPRILTILIKEMEELEREISETGNSVKYHAPDGEDSHDDSVFSLSLAHWLMDYAQMKEAVFGGDRYPLRGGVDRKGFLGLPRGEHNVIQKESLVKR